jgi:D-serine deaminase-like pyridoxal phosphate-dependent protein
MDLTAPQIGGVEAIRTPALVIDLDAVNDNISATLRLLGGRPDRWRPHLKTAKLALVMKALVERGVRQAKCSTTLELETACKVGYSDVLLAYPVTEPQAELVRRIATAYAAVNISVLVEDPAMLAPFRGSTVGIFIDLNPGMDRTGLDLERYPEILGLARGIGAARLRYAGLHFYDGHAHGFEPRDAERLVHAGYDRLLELVSRLRADGIATPEVITAGTPAFPHALAYRGFTQAGVTHRTSPGTVVYNDRKSLTQLPADAGYRPAALVLSTVVSHPSAARFCADAGHKAVSADAGVPTCEVLGHPDFIPRQPNEEHLPVDVMNGARLPARGERLWLLPSHVCPTVNNFDHAVIVAGGAVRGLERVTARGRHAPME